MAIADSTVKQELRNRNADAVALGVFGVPTMTIGDERFWGDHQLTNAAIAAARLHRQAT